MGEVAGGGGGGGVETNHQTSSSAEVKIECSRTLTPLYYFMARTSINLALLDKADTVID